MFRFLGIEGLDAFELNTAELKKVVVAARIMALKRGAEVFKRAWKQKVHENFYIHGKGYWTGTYYSNVKVTDIVAVPSPVGDLVGIEVGVDLKGVPIKGNPNYPFFLEYGWYQGGKQHGPFPTMEPAFKESREEVILVSAEVFGSYIEAFRPVAKANDFAYGTAVFNTKIASMESQYNGKTLNQILNAR